jgi:hypothetical protein
MKNRLLELEGQLKQLRAPSWGYAAPPRKAKPPGGNGAGKVNGNGKGQVAAPPPAAPAKAQALGRYRMPISAMLSRSISYTTPGHVPPIAQDKDYACWAAVTTMMMSWRDNTVYSIGDATSKIGAKWRALYDAGATTGLAAADKPAFLAAAGLSAEPPANYTIERWETLLREYGPLWVTTNEGFGTPYFAIHARIVTGISGDGTPGGTTLAIVDPAGAKTYSENFQTFVSKYEDDVRHVATPRIQIVHWARGARK